MQECMSKYPALYGTDKDDDREDEFAQLEQEQAAESHKQDTDSSSKQPSS